MSPLFLGAEGLPASRLRILGQRLRDTLVGDVVRGVEVGLDGAGDGIMGNAGALETVAVEWVAAYEAVSTPRPALQVTLQYENALCSAVLLPLPDAETHASDVAEALSASFLHLPLLLLRMPMSLKTVVIDFLSGAFDCRISSLCLSSKDIVQAWESWARVTALPTHGPLAKDAVLTLAFRFPGTWQPLDKAENEASKEPLVPPIGDGPNSAVLGIKTVDIFVPNDELRGFFKAGQKLGLAPSNAEGTPFTDSLAYYLKRHLALDITNDAVAIVRVACGGFVLSETRLKMFGVSKSGLDTASSRHRAVVQRIFGDLVVCARG